MPQDRARPAKGRLKTKMLHRALCDTVMSYVSWVIWYRHIVWNTKTRIKFPIFNIVRQDFRGWDFGLIDILTAQHNTWRAWRNCLLMDCWCGWRYGCCSGTIVSASVSASVVLIVVQHNDGNLSVSSLPTSLETWVGSIFFHPPPISGGGWKLNRLKSSTWTPFDKQGYNTALT